MANKKKKTIIRCKGWHMPVSTKPIPEIYLAPPIDPIDEHKDNPDRLRSFRIEHVHTSPPYPYIRKPKA